MTPSPDSPSRALSRPIPVECVCWPEIAGRRAVLELAVTRDAVAATVSALRRMVRAWVAETTLDEEQAESVVLAVDEAVTNAVEHAYPEQPGKVRLMASARRCGGGYAISVTDHGCWRPIPSDPGHRGRGLMLIHAIADRASVDHTEDGTTVRMCWTTGASSVDAELAS